MLKYILDGNGKSDKVIVLVPGTNGGDILFDLLSIHLQKKGFAVARLDAWKSGEEIDKLTVKQIVRFIENMFSDIVKKGLKVEGIIAKSFGAIPTLYIERELAPKYILIAPAVNLASDIDEKIYDKTLNVFKSFEEIPLKDSKMSKILNKILILYGSEDKVVKKENIVYLRDKIKHAKLEIIDGAGHSFKEEQSMKRLFEEIDYFLGKS